MTSKVFKKPSRTTNLSAEEQFWNQVEAHSKNLIARLVEANLPISAPPQVFDLEKDVDYRVLLRDDFPQFYQEQTEYQTKIAQGSWTAEEVEGVAQELTCCYWEIVVKRLLEDLSSYPGFENTILARCEQ